MHRAFRVGKRVQTETQLGRGAAGIAPAAVDLARQIFSSLEGKTALLVGAGQTAECAAKALLSAGAGRLIVANRTLSRAQQLAYDLVHKPAEQICGVEGEACGEDAAEGPVACPALLAQAAETSEGEVEGEGETLAPAAEKGAALAGPETEAIGLEDLPRVLARADLVISSTGAESAVLTYAALAGVLRGRGRPLLVIDIAVPRDVEERLGEIDNVFLYNIDDLNRLVGRNLERRRQEIPRAEAIVDDELRDFADWLASLQVAPTIKLLREFVEALQKAHFDRYGRQFTDADRANLEHFTETLLSQVLHRPTMLLRDLAQRGATSESLEMVDLVRRLFDLDSQEKK
jgi:glutamyl-tRNA reductase